MALTERFMLGADGSDLELPSAWILDLDGVVWTGSDPIAGSAQAIDRLQSEGWPTLFVTNNSFSRISELEDKLAKFGVRAEGMVVSSAAAAASLLESGSRAFVLGGPGVLEALAERDVEAVGTEEAEHDGVDAVVVGLDWELSYRRLSAAVLAIRAGARFVATNTDATYPSERGFLPGGGAIVAAVQTATDVVPEVAGKPFGPQAQLVRSVIDRHLGDGSGRLGTSPLLMVGDRPDTDGRFAGAMGARFGLVLSGVTQAADLPVDPQPAVVATDLLELVDKVL